MSSTALTVSDRNAFSLFSEDAYLKEALASIDETISPSDLIRVTVPTAGGKMWQIEGAGGVESVEKLEGIFILVQKEGVLWPSLEMEEGSHPVLKTYDLQVAEQNGPIPPDLERLIEPYRLSEKTFDWAGMSGEEGPFGFGSGKDGHGKRVKEIRRVYMLRPGDLFPLVVNIPPASLSNFLKWFKQIPNATKRPYYHSVVSLGLEQAISEGGKKFSRVVPKVLHTMSDADGAAVKRTYHEMLVRVNRQLADEPNAD